jgi:7-cyano-7-deazaguanine synthase in queuosine biosynthesis
MSHHTIALRIGAQDRTPITSPRQDTVFSDVPFLDGYDRPLYGVAGVLAQLDDAGLTPTTVAAELLMLATAIMAADTRISRSQHAENRWTREIELWLPVSDPALWNQQSSVLDSMLRFLTGDFWKICFRPLPRNAPEWVRPTEKLRMAEPTCVSLFSGGLDSFIGAVDLLSCHERPLLVSHWWDTHASRHQTHCISALVERYPDETLWHLRANVGMDHNTMSDSSVENTQRGRSFMFFALAVLAATAVGEGVPIYVPENGLISLNVPLDPLRVGALSTRTTHPFYMSKFNDMLRGLGIGSQLHNPYRHKTKGEMANDCCDRDFLEAHANITMSCSAEGKYRRYHDPARRTIGHCGHCVPCLIRRASLEHAFGADDTAYWLSDLRDGPIDSNTALGADMRAFQLALARLALDPSRARLEIHLPGPLPRGPEDLAGYERVYRNGMREVANLLAGVDVRPMS